jgi:hypothetical protein
MKRAAFQIPTKDVFQRWAAMPEWEKRYRRFYAIAPESAYKALKIAFLITAILSGPFRGWKRRSGRKNKNGGHLKAGI